MVCVMLSELQYHGQQRRHRMASRGRGAPTRAKKYSLPKHAATATRGASSQGRARAWRLVTVLEECQFLGRGFPNP